jgi:hypothetical protein
MGLAGYAEKLTNTGESHFGFRGVSAQKSARKVRVTDVERERIAARVDELSAIRSRMPLKAKLDYVVASLQTIREIGYNSSAARATDTVLACIRVAEDGLSNVGRSADTAKPSRAITEAIEVAVMGSK